MVNPISKGLWLLLALAVNVKAEKMAAELQITPSVCLLTRLESKCNIDVSIKWQLRKAVDSCLLEEDKTVECWVKQKKGDTQVGVSSKKTLRYALAQQPEGPVLGETELVVLREQNKRRRRKNAWSLF